MRCQTCHNQIVPRSISRLRKNKDYKRYCSAECRNIGQQTGKTLICKICNKSLYRTQSAIKKNTTGNFFCSRSCSATYRNLNKTTGIRRSKLEKYIEEQLSNKYPNLEILFNDKSVINSELDIYIPSLKLAFELNGIFHYEPIFGEDKLSQIENNDKRKFQACLEKSIELCIIDTSSQKYFKPKSSQKFLDIVVSLIELKSSP